MVISVLIKALLPSGDGVDGTVGGIAHTPLPKNEKGAKEWIRNKLKGLALLPGRLGVKVAEVLAGIIGVILNWIFNSAADIMSWVL